MELGAFSVSLNVMDLQASRDFYEILGFTVFGGDIGKNYLIMKNGQTLIGLFQGMFDKTMLTFNPGWDQQAQNLPEYMDVRQIHDSLSRAGIPILNASLSETSGPGSFAVQDPDGNPILIDQHI
jgi:catechol 2,3-dioxygenase-like lactoylglutathione lyase family enzyme